MGGEAPGFRFNDVELHGADADLAADPALLFPCGESLDCDIGTEAQLADIFSESIFQGAKTFSRVQRDSPELVVVIARRNAVADDPKRQPLRMTGQRILVELEHVIGQNSADSPPAFRTQCLVDQQRTVQIYKEPGSFGVEVDVQTSQTRSVDQRQHAVFSAPRVIGCLRICEADAESSVSGDSPLGEDRQRVACFGRKTLERIAVEAHDARHINSW
jgi:hypothetical protein